MMDDWDRHMPDRDEMDWRDHLPSRGEVLTVIFSALLGAVAALATSSLLQ